MGGGGRENTMQIYLSRGLRPTVGAIPNIGPQSPSLMPHDNTDMEWVGCNLIITIMIIKIITTTIILFTITVCIFIRVNQRSI